LREDSYSTYTNNQLLVQDGFFTLDFKVKVNTGTSELNDFEIKVQ